MIKKILAIILGVLDIALLVVIIVSAVSGWRIGSDNGDVLTVSDNTDTPQTASSSPSDMSAQPSEVSKQEPSAQPSDVSKQEPSAQQSEVSKQEPSAQSSGSVIPDGISVGTKAYPSMSDFANFDIKGGWKNKTSSASAISEAYQALGGWKAYMLCDPEQKRGSTLAKLMNIELSFGQSDMIVRINWYQTILPSGEIISDDTPDSEFRGSWNGSGINAVGSGSIGLSGFIMTAARNMLWGR